MLNEKLYDKCTSDISTLDVRFFSSWVHDGKDGCMILIDYRDTKPIYEQIADKFKTLILHDVLHPDDKLPSVRNLAVELSINPNTIQHAYAELERQGYIYTVKGRGNFVSDSGQLLLKYRDELFDQLNVICKAAFDIGITEEEIVQKIKALD